MKYNPDIHHRQSLRLKAYDYSSCGLYFITICVQNKHCLFGHIDNKTMILNDAGRMVKMEWLNLIDRFDSIKLHEYCVMPNHFHAILEINNNNNNNNNNVGVALVATQSTGQPMTQSTGQPMTQSTGQPTTQPTTQSMPQSIGQPQGFAPTTQPTTKPTGQSQGFAPTHNHKTIGDMIGAFKSISTVQYIRGVKHHHWQSFNGKLWQRNYYEHIIRNESSYQIIAHYIINNPAQWDDDTLYQ
jgi:putative transposase